MQSAPAIDLSTIPAAQRAAVVALMETVVALTEITRRQEHLIAELNHADGSARHQQTVPAPHSTHSHSAQLRRLRRGEGECECGNSVPRRYFERADADKLTAQ